jgi:hypothetical protein
VKRSVLVAGLVMATVLVSLGVAQPTQAATSTKVVRYGPSPSLPAPTPIRG